MSLQDRTDSDHSLAGRIARSLAQRIVTGTLAPGAPLRQDHVAAEFGASHVPVREAFRTLEAQGLLVSEPRRGVRVAPLEPDLVLEVTAMRAALEALALRQGFPRLTAADLDEASAALAEAEASGELLVWQRANERFHRAITAPCRMKRLLATIDDLHRTSARFLFATWRDLAWQPRSDAEHRQILDHLVAGRIEQAAQTLETHILNAGQALAEKLQSGPVPSR
ncbi:GntR family transcriptional regulator [Bosea sp. LjRoot90]|uniref:GntR family transcriptional regulator n=1 Tax=Bosea sp. LjRoot90 TaxID=3342342 RepID=UPI003ECE4809